MLSEGRENNIYWCLNDKGRKIEIIVKNEETNVEDIYIYECHYEPIFGYDCLDVSEVNKILDNMINKFIQNNYFI